MANARGRKGRIGRMASMPALASMGHTSQTRGQWRTAAAGERMGTVEREPMVERRIDTANRELTAPVTGECLANASIAGIAGVTEGIADITAGR